MSDDLDFPFGHKPNADDVCTVCGLRKPEEFYNRTCVEHLRIKEDLLRDERDSLRAHIAETDVRVAGIESERDHFRVEYAKLREFRLCSDHMNKIDAETYGRDTCVMCLINDCQQQKERATNAEAERDALRVEVAELKAKIRAHPRL